MNARHGVACLTTLYLIASFAIPARADREGNFIFNEGGATAVLTGYTTAQRSAP